MMWTMFFVLYKDADEVNSMLTQMNVRHQESMEQYQRNEPLTSVSMVYAERLLKMIGGTISNDRN